MTEFYDIHVVETFLKLAIRIVFLIKVGSLTCKILNESIPAMNEIYMYSILQIALFLIIYAVEPLYLELG